MQTRRIPFAWGLALVPLPLILLVLFVGVAPIRAVQPQADLDFGDAPDPPYPTLLNSDTGYHILGSDVYLGGCVDGEPDGQPTSAADGDDTNTGSPTYGSCTRGDEDGVAFVTPLYVGGTAGIVVSANAACTLTAWVDFNADGDWADVGEDLFPSGQALTPGPNPLNFAVPVGSVEGNTYARFRCTTDGKVSLYSVASDGEAEDYRVTISADWDFGDAPDPPYPTLLGGQVGARHLLGSDVYLGACVDAEPDGQPTSAADGDDTTIGSPVFGTCEDNDDEDGVTFVSDLLVGETANVEVVASAPCLLGAWIDFSADGDWGDAGEDLFPGRPWLAAGTNVLTFTVPQDAVESLTYARFRCTTDEWVDVTGAAWDGEVEDYRIRIGPLLDFGDAPDPTYPTLLANAGASHVLGSPVYLGACVDAEVDGQPSYDAQGDDLSVSAPAFGTCAEGGDEDGVTFTSDLIAGSDASVDVVANEDCTLSAWIDFNLDGDWADAAESLFPTGQALVIGTNSLTFTVPPGAIGGPAPARFRCTTDGVVGFTGQASDGEVEDYIALVGALDFGDAPDPAYPTTIMSAGASHVLGSDVYLGSCVDAEVDGQPSVAADGDDVGVGSTVFGTCGNDDDEDGVTFKGPLLAGQTADVDVVANAACTLSAWIDFNADGDWSDSGESLFPGGQALVPGVNPLSFSVLAGAEEGVTYARFRCTTDGAVLPVGPASDGEVEDYRVGIGSVLDLGDAPDPTYPTLLASSGASHLLGSSVYLGSCVDAEADGQPSVAADGDDVNIGSPVLGTCVRDDDEDGVSFLTALYIGETADIQVVANAACTLSAWVDFNADGDWADAGESLFPGGQALAAGPNLLSFPVPAGAEQSTTYARFRCTTDGAVGPTGQASDGEVEDYRVSVGPIQDFGDAPDPTYPTLLASSGASHVLGSAVYLGGCVDAEPDGQPSIAADGDDVNVGSLVLGTCAGNDDEDGVTFKNGLPIGGMADIDVVANAACTLSAWVDFNADGDWLDGGESLFPGGQALVPGVNPLSFSVPAGAEEGVTYARFRCTTDGAVGFTGQASDGEVEDYRVGVGDILDFGDAPDPTYPTLLASSGASHLLGSSVYLGSCVDAETDGQPSVGADDDDVNIGSPVLGSCTHDDDEDGVDFVTPLYAGGVAGVQVVANAACTLSAWVDFNADGDWSDGGESLFPGGRALVPGVNPLSFSVPAGAEEGVTYARFRCTTDGAVGFTGQASDGEVEDYQVSVVPSLDLGDAPEPDYPTLLASSGASHVLGSDVYLGSCVDAEFDGQPSAMADGDDANAGSPVFGTCEGGDDEDGVTFLSALESGQVAAIEVTANAPCTLTAWIDFDQSDGWESLLGGSETLFPGGRALVAGTSYLTFTVPSVAEGFTYARFRCTTDGAVGYTGPASDGEVEDYRVRIGPPLDLGDALDPPYPTLWANAGATHTLGSDVYLGSCVDAEFDGQPSATADGDDANASGPVFGTCVEGDDEDGVTFVSELLVGETADVEVVASAACTLAAWIDFNADGDWTDAGESLFPGGQVIAAGVNVLTFTVSTEAAMGDTYARFRCTTGGPVGPTGGAPDGEVEDYLVRVRWNTFHLPLVLRN